MTEPAQFDPYAMPADALREPPPSLWTALAQIGPGIILAGSIIGTGELLLTTSLGAKYGFTFLWLILYSCVIKVFVQVELGRYAISSGKPTLGALDALPGPRLGAHWLVWWWFVMLLATVSQLGAMTGGVGQAFHLMFPTVSPAIADSCQSVSPWLADWVRERPSHPWAVLTCIAAIALLVTGTYRRIELLTTFLVVSVTLVTVGCVAMLPYSGYPITASDIGQGFTFALPAAGIAAAFSMFGITGVGASELYSYPYWCLEKGYARFAGPRSDSPEWARRARGWMRVLWLDAWVSMFVFTVATVAFYLMGAKVLHQLKLFPSGARMMEDLSEMYVQAFGHPWTRTLFLIGAVAVLFKTLYVASAGHSRLTADFFNLAGMRYSAPQQRGRWIQALCVFYPAFALVLFLIFGEPRAMVVFGGFAQAATLPVISGATLYLRYRRTDRRLAPSRFTDICLWFAVISITAAAVFSIQDLARKTIWPEPVPPAQAPK